MWEIYIRTEGLMTLFWKGEATRKEAIAKRGAAASAAKARGLAGGASVIAYGPSGRIKIGIHGYK